ncbi:MAG TPA: trypsin-like peptidase domain-containing protein [Ktedonobacterales bacterium]|nr:trypsin-like peptidase domain-containing protein [Ktedonobacterales bacterium]
MSATDLIQLSESLAEVAGQVRDGVVQVRTGQGGIGSGVVWRAGTPDTNGVVEATVITNAHVARAAQSRSFTLRLADGSEIPATLSAIDPEHDLAALQTRGVGLRAVEIGDSAALRVGELVFAIGNPFGREGAVTFGVVAARAPADPDISLEPAEEGEAPRGRRGPGQRAMRGMEVIQADIRLYPGNSGGPLADAHGRVVGVNAMVGGGLAFAIPSGAVRRFLQEAEAMSQPVVLGVSVLTVEVPATLRTRLAIQQATAALVAEVASGSAAAQAGLLPGDLLLRIDGRAITVAEQLPALLRRGAADQPRTLDLVRGGERLTLTAAPEQQAAA